MHGSAPVLLAVLGVPLVACGIDVSGEADLGADDASASSDGSTPRNRPPMGGGDASAGSDAPGPDAPADTGSDACAPLSCVSQGKNCGDLPDGCGHTLHCGDCNGHDTCGGGGQPNVCGCTQAACCLQNGYECGTCYAGCGATHVCGNYGGGCKSGDACDANQKCVPMPDAGGGQDAGTDGGGIIDAGSPG